MISLLLCAGGIGAGTLKLLRVPVEQRGEFLALSLAAGMGLLAVALGVLGLFGVLSWSRWLLPVGAVISLGWFGYAWRHDTRPEWRRPSRATLTAVVVLGVASLGAIAPVTNADSLAYPIPTAQQLAAEGQWRFWPHLARSVYPLSQQFLNAAQIIQGDDRLGLPSAVQFLLTALLIVWLANRVLARPGAGWVAAIIALGCPAAAFIVGAAKEDLLVTMMTVAGALALTLRPGPGSVTAAGLFAGLAAGAKYTGLPIAIALVACVPFTCGRERRAASLVVAVLVALAAGGLWYGVNLARFGNPLAPAFPSLGSFPTSPAIVAKWLGGWGYGRGLVDFVLAPFRMALEVATFDAGYFGGRSDWINPLAWIGAPWALLMWRRRPAFLPLLVVAFVLYVVWFNGTQVARLLLPSLVLLAVPAADAVLSVWDRFRATRVPIGFVLAVSASLAVIVGAVRFTRYVADPGGFIGRETDYHDAIQWMNTHLDPRRHRVATDLKASAYLTIPWMNLAVSYQVEIAQEEQDDSERLRAALLRQGFTHVYGLPYALDDPPDWLVPVYFNPDSLEGGTHFLRTPPTGPITVYAVR